MRDGATGGQRRRAVRPSQVPPKPVQEQGPRKRKLAMIPPRLLSLEAMGWY